MRYRLRTFAEHLLAPIEGTLGVKHRLFSHPRFPFSDTRLGRYPAAALESAIRLIKPYPKQKFCYEPIQTDDGRSLRVYESVVMHKPFCELRRFRTQQTATAPKLLFVAAMSGHHATLSKDTLREFLPDFDVYITDWVDARLVPLSDGHFGLEDYMAYLIDFLDELGPDVHVIGLCQAAVPALCAAALMAEDKHPHRPRTLSLLAGPIDIRVKRNRVTRYTEKLPLAMMRLNIHKVPRNYPGAGRRVYPGYLQLINFVSLNVKTHVRKHVQFFKDVAQRNKAAAEKHRSFYDEYNAVMDCTAEFYLETLERVFFDQHLPKGTMQFRGRTVNCAAIRDIPLLTLEGADDEMVAVGVTQAAHDLCTNLPDTMREHCVQDNVGHYGIFNGSIYKTHIAPRMKAFMGKHGNQLRSAYRTKVQRSG